MNNSYENFLQTLFQASQEGLQAGGRTLEHVANLPDWGPRTVKNGSCKKPVALQIHVIFRIINVFMHTAERVTLLNPQQLPARQALLPGHMLRRNCFIKPGQQSWHSCCGYLSR
jgi:hypothetical protein